MKRLILIFVSIFSIVFASQANTFTVTTNADNGAGSLRQALADIANLNTGIGGHTIIFNAGMTITLNNSLQLNADTDFNGLTINGFVDATSGPDVIIRSNNQCGVRGFDINGSNINMKFYGLVFQNLEYGIYFNASASGTVNGSQIKGCYFGTDITGSTIQNGICKSGVTFIGVSSAIIGGPNTNLPNGAASSSNNSERCLFGGTCLGANAGDNSRYGAIQLQNGSNNVSILNNYIGVNLASTAVLPIGNTTNKKPVSQNGISIDNDPSFNTIISNNVISGAIGSGINIFTNSASNGHLITGNIIGLDATGTLGYNVTTPASSFGNQASGIYIRNASNVTIGGSTAATRNVISANGGATHTWPDPGCFASWNDYNQIAIYLEWCLTTKISGNYIGTNAAGTSSGIGTNNILGNRSGGIKIVGGSTGANNNVIGGSNAGEGNVISGNGYLWGTFAVGSCGSLSNISTGHGIVLQYADCRNTSILGNYIGLTADGVTGLGNNTSGIDIQGASNTIIGGSTAGARNFICDNQFGITLQEDFDVHNAATNTTVAGNYIGLNKNATAVGNGVSASFTEGAGIVIQKGANLNTIGTAVAGGGNVISGNRSGIIIRNAEGAGSNTGPARNNTIQNNIIGLDPTGTSAIPNTSATTAYGYGIQLEVGTGSATTTIPFGNIIGGTGANQANTISSNQKSGIFISSTAAVTASTANSIIGNKIGTNAAGTGDFGNTLQGIEIVNVSKTTITSNTISGNDQNGISLTATTTNAISSNTITTNSVNGIFLTGSSTNTIQGNTISSNTSNGISLAAASANNIIGGVASGEANTINTNGANGVLVDGATSINNSIHKNSFSCNTLRGIVLSNGGNASLAAPIANGTPTQITWTGGTFIEVYETDGCATCPTSPTRLQGKTLVASGASPFAFTIALGFDANKKYTALAHQGSTTAAHNTSEFSTCYTLCQDPTSVTITGAPLTFCAGGSVTLTASIVGGSGTPTYVWRKDGVVTGGNTATLVATAAGSYTVEYSSTTTCGSTTSTGVTVTVNPRPTITSATTNTLCSGVAQNYTITSSIPSTYSWSRAALTGISNAAVTNSSANPITEALINTTTAPIDVVYTITATSTTGSCTNVTPFTYTVTVNPKPVINSSGSNSICSGNAQNYTITSNVPASYSWSRAAVTGISNAAVTNSSANPITEALVNTTTAPINVVYTINATSTTGSCPSAAPFTYTVTVNPKPVINSSGSNAVCSGDAQNYTITSNVPASYSWSRAAVTGIGNAAVTNSSVNPITEALVNTTTAPINVVYTITATSTSGSCPSAAPFTYTVTVNPKPVINSSGSNAVCSGNAQNYTITSNVPASYSWSRAAVTGISNAAVTNSSVNPITEALVNTTTAPIDVVYTITATSTSGSCPSAAPFTYTVTVNPKPVINSSGSNAVCSGDAQNYTITSNVPASYLWSRAAVTGIGNAAVTNSSVNPITEALVNTTTAPINVVYTITATSTSGSCPSASPFTYTVTVNPKPVINSAGSSSVCSGNAQNYTITSNVPASYSWSRAAVTGISNAAVTNSSANPIIEALVNTTTAPINVVYTITATSTSGSCPSAAPFTYTVTVNPKPEIISLATNTVCGGDAQNYTISSNVPASYSWSRAAVTGISNAAVTNSSVNPITEALVNTTTAPIDVVYTITATSTSGSCPSAAPFTYTVTVNPKPVINSSGSNAVCSGNAHNYTITSNVPASYSWSRAALTGISNPAVTNSSVNPISETLVNTTTAPINVVYTITATSTSGSCPSAAPFTYTVTVNPKPVVTITPSGPTAFCSNQSVDLTATITGPTGGTVEWFNGSTSLGNANPLTVSTAGSYTVVYTSTSSCVSDPSASTSITINPNNSIAEAGIDFSTCIGAATLTGNMPVNGTGSWSVVLPSTAVVTPGATSNVADATFLIDGNVYKFIYTVSGACGPDQTDEVEVTAGLTGFDVSASGPTDTLCVLTNRTLTATATGGSGDYSYIWVSSDGSFSSTSPNGNVTVQPVAGGETTYTVYVIDNLNTGCKTDDATVKIHAIESQDLDIPNLITPNGDHLNDIFILKDKVTKMDIIKDGSHIEVVNRWGSKVYEANNYENNWIPKDLTDGMYYYHITSTCGNKEYKSWLQILGNTNN